MYKKSNEQDMSELEQEFELETDDLELEEDFETDDFEFESDEESEHNDNEYEFENDFENEFEADYEDEPQGEYEWLEASDAGYAERFFELSQREFESEAEIDQAFNEILNEIDEEFFLGGVLGKAKKMAKKLAQKGTALAKKAGIKLPAIEALKSMLGPAAGILKGNLGSLIKPALKAALSAHPAGMAALPALKALGFESSEDMGENREAWDNYVAVAQEAFEHLAANVNENIDNPLEASRLATNAFQAGLKKVKSRKGFLQQKGRAGNLRKGKVRRIYIAPGEILVIKRKRR